MSLFLHVEPQIVKAFLQTVIVSQISLCIRLCGLISREPSQTEYLRVPCLLHLWRLIEQSLIVAAVRRFYFYLGTFNVHNFEKVLLRAAHVV